MREIKFRVWDKVTKKMFTGFYLFGEMTLTGGIHAWQHEESEAIGIKRDTLGALNDLVEMQYTGLKDKNGKEIYEGDIVICNDYTRDYKGQVIFDTGAFCIDCASPILCEMESITLIGNVHENPELL